VKQNSTDVTASANRLFLFFFKKKLKERHKEEEEKNHFHKEKPFVWMSMRMLSDENRIIFFYSAFIDLVYLLD
jgi:hypothetical protein